MVAEKGEIDLIRLLLNGIFLEINVVALENYREERL
jgi:hypothetical protein